VERPRFALLTGTGRVVAAASPSRIRTTSPACRGEAPPKPRVRSQKAFSNTSWREPNIGQGQDKAAARATPSSPTWHLTKDRFASTTFLLGSQENPLPANYQYRLSITAATFRRLVGRQEIHCMAATSSSQSEDLLMAWPLSGERTARSSCSQAPHRRRARQSRVALRFLKNPSLTDKDDNQRRALLFASAHAHLLLFRKRAGQLVRFFQALSRQPFPYIPDEVPVLTAKEPRWLAASFSSTKKGPRPAQCTLPAIPPTIALPPLPFPAGPRPLETRFGWSAG